ncbi:hypothetical protein [Rariglobus hedericola]|uniref:Uncharacterized protein n=1 Tax=Rariglobus hedericola TaxID=2597822 RepID=A0A556QP50_9BACT|nr:hypothetical protein [Rariglobus hedericola]TSJ78411.1 hypothetical protein FPL22_03690 [Rariglobus hedericola]
MAPSRPLFRKPSGLRGLAAFIPAFLLVLGAPHPGQAKGTDTKSGEAKVVYAASDDALPAGDKLIVTAFIRHAVEFAKQRNPERVSRDCARSPESFAWVDFRYLNCLNISYELTGDTQYLDLFRDTFRLYLDILRPASDGFLGWMGSPIPSRLSADNPTLQIDELQMSFRAISILSRWIELARVSPSYADQNQETIKAYLDLMESQLYPKWDKRGYFAETGEGRGVYRGLDFPSDGFLTLAHEKTALVVDGLLALHRVTGNDSYLKRALQLGARFKDCLSLVDGHYEWLSWCPAGPWDVAPGGADAWKVGWMAPDPRGEWYAAGVSIATSLYRHGLLFTDEDIGRFLRTQKEMCWNGDTERPAYRTVSGQANKFTVGRFLSYQLAHYDETLSRLAFRGPHEEEAGRNAASSWLGGADAQDYVREKFVVAPGIRANPRSFEWVGRRFLENPPNRALHEQLDRERTTPDVKVPCKPSQVSFAAAF